MDIAEGSFKCLSCFTLLCLSKTIEYEIGFSVEHPSLYQYQYIYALTLHCEYLATFGLNFRYKPEIIFVWTHRNTVRAQQLLAPWWETLSFHHLYPME